MAGTARLEKEVDWISLTPTVHAHKQVASVELLSRGCFVQQFSGRVGLLTNGRTTAMMYLYTCVL